jgi:hypothetical protein
VHRAAADTQRADLIGALPAYKAQSEYDLSLLFLAFSSALLRSGPAGMVEELDLDSALLVAPAEACH